MELPINPLLYWRTVLTILVPLVLIRGCSQKTVIIIVIQSQIEMCGAFLPYLSCALFCDQFSGSIPLTGDPEDGEALWTLWTILVTQVMPPGPG